MDKREEIDHLIDVCFLGYLSNDYENVIIAREDLKAQLHSAGVVIKSSTCPNCLEPEAVRVSAYNLANRCGKCGWTMPPECSFVEPLIKE